MLNLFQLPTHAPQVRLHLLGDDELSWMRGSISLRDVEDLSQGRFPEEENATGPDPMEVHVVDVGVVDVLTYLAARSTQQGP